MNVGRLPCIVAVSLALLGCEVSAPNFASLGAQEPISVADFAALIERVSEPGGYFDTDNLISNETGYLNVMDALERLGLQGGAYVGVGPDQNFSYIAALRPEIVFITDVRRDNLLHHLLLKALIERAPTRVEFLSALHGVAPPADAHTWRDRPIGELVAFVDSAWVRRASAQTEDVTVPHDDLAGMIAAYGVPLSDGDYATIRRFHRTFIDAGLGLRFSTFGRAPRPYYPTFRQLVLETDVDGDQASYLATAERYDVVRKLQLANRIIPVVGDLSGSQALREMGEVMRELGVELTAFYASNVEFYLWQSGTFDRWAANLVGLPVADRAVVIRSYFPNFGGGHPSAVPGYYATQLLQRVSTLRVGGFSSYWQVVTRDVIQLR